MLIDHTAEVFKGELGTIKQIATDYSLKELSEYRDIRLDRKKAEAEAQEKIRKAEQTKREREASRHRR